MCRRFLWCLQISELLSFISRSCTLGFPHLQPFSYAETSCSCSLSFSWTHRHAGFVLEDQSQLHLKPFSPFNLSAYILWLSKSKNENFCLLSLALWITPWRTSKLWWTKTWTAAFPASGWWQSEFVRPHPAPHLCVQRAVYLFKWFPTC